MQLIFKNMRTMLLLVVLALLCSPMRCSYLVTSASTFKDLVPSPNTTYQFLSYVSNHTWTPAALRWNCNVVTNLCTHDCEYVFKHHSVALIALRTPLANGPVCSQPTLPNDLDLDRWPWQARWGDPFPCCNGSTGLPAGIVELN